jgi:hypothetical protein
LALARSGSARLEKAEVPDVAFGGKLFAPKAFEGNIQDHEMLYSLTVPRGIGIGG